MAEPIFVVLYCDADVTPKLARLLRELGFDVVSTYEVGNMELTDAEQLAYAVNHGRAILTHNSKDFAPLFDQYWWEGRKHPGVIVSEQLPVGELLRRAARLLSTITADELSNSYRDLAEFATR